MMRMSRAEGFEEFGMVPSEAGEVEAFGLPELVVDVDDHREFTFSTSRHEPDGQFARQPVS